MADVLGISQITLFGEILLCNTRWVFGSDVLPDYHYRDDGLLVYNAIVAYTTKYIDLYYGGCIVKETGQQKPPRVVSLTHARNLKARSHDYEEKIGEDFELQAWASELTKSREEGGLGINGVPGEGRLSTYEHLVKVMASVIFTCTAGHAAVGGRATCEQYAFPPAYPTFMRGAPPSEKAERAEEDMLQTLPDQYQSALASLVSSSLCGDPICRLGESRLRYIMDPSATAICLKFQEELEEARHLINWRNKKRVCPYTSLNPRSIPNTPFS